MLHYPKIPSSSKPAPIGKCVAFEKLDGTNLHWCWDRDFGWHAFAGQTCSFAEEIAQDVFEERLVPAGF